MTAAPAPRPRSAPVFLALAAAATLTGRAAPAEACGGFFCAPQAPVIQTGEQILFSVNRADRTVDAIINIQYSGPAEDFVWILPLQSAPLDLQVGAQSVFQTINQQTGPRFGLSFETEGRCRAGLSLADSDSASAVLAEGVGGAQDPSGRFGGVQVLSRAAVGPYDSVVLDGTSVRQIRAWLEDNGYGVTDAMMRPVTPYLQKGDVLLALKLRKDAAVGEIQPVHVTMTGDEVCVPIRLTAIAALEDMPITVSILTDEGRAIPENFFEVELNWARLDWLNLGANYRELVAEAADEGQGHAFVTEYAGSTERFADQVHPGYAPDRLRQRIGLAAFLDEASRMGLANRAGFGPIVRRHLATSWTVPAEDFDRCPACFAFDAEGVRIDAEAAVDELAERIVEPERRAQALFDAHPRLTRLYTSLSPDEMDVDPEFAVRTDLPDVDNLRTATVVTRCGFAGQEVGRHLRIEAAGSTIEVDVDEATGRPAAAGLPASARIRQLAEGLDYADNRGLIEEALSGGSCRCAGRAGSSSAAPLLGLALLAGLILRRRA